MKRKELLRILVGWGFTFTVAVLLLILSDSKPYQILELKALDLRFNLRGSRPTDVDLLHIDIDDESLDKLGRWPWPRSYHAKLIDILAECGAKKVLMDILFTERLKDNPEDDVAFARAQSRSGIVYLPFYFLEDKQPPPPELKELLDKDITVSVEDAQTELNAGDDLLQDILPLAKKYVMDEAVRGLVRKNPDIKEDDLISAIEESKEWYLFAEEEAYIRGNLESYKLARFFVNKFAIDYQKQGFLKLKEYNRLSAPIREYIESIKGTGYINADPDQDGVMRRVPLFIKYEDRMFA
ncbi:MAG: CHASE2 domain-containing protein, partial [Deltaproteobacteria bacterium]|nr:CHASE2 domain-containing protein [Deltaproteobacteria bacterium]